MFRLAVLFFLASSVAQAQSFGNTIDCDLFTSSVADYTGKDWQIDSKIEKKPMKVTFTDILSDRPKLVGNLGSSDLIKLEGSNDTTYLLEKTPVGNINLWTYFPSTKAMLMTKQYQLGENPFGMLMYGDCKGR